MVGAPDKRHFMKKIIGGTVTADQIRDGEKGLKQK
jgi:hypothetical protein